MKKIGKSSFPVWVSIAIIGVIFSLTLVGGGILVLSFLSIWAITHPNEFWIWIQVVKRSLPLVWENKGKRET